MHVKLLVCLLLAQHAVSVNHKGFFSLSTSAPPTTAPPTTAPPTTAPPTTAPPTTSPPTTAPPTAVKVAECTQKDSTGFSTECEAKNKRTPFCVNATCTAFKSGHPLDGQGYPLFLDGKNSAFIPRKILTQAPAEMLFRYAAGPRVTFNGTHAFLAIGQQLQASYAREFHSLQESESGYANVVVNKCERSIMAESSAVVFTEKAFTTKYTGANWHNRSAERVVKISAARSFDDNETAFFKQDKRTKTLSAFFFKSQLGEQLVELSKDQEHLDMIRAFVQGDGHKKNIDQLLASPAWANLSKEGKAAFSSLAKAKRALNNCMHLENAPGLAVNATHFILPLKTNILSYRGHTVMSPMRTFGIFHGYTVATQAADGSLEIFFTGLAQSFLQADPFVSQDGLQKSSFFVGPVDGVAPLAVDGRRDRYVQSTVPWNQQQLALTLFQKAMAIPENYNYFWAKRSLNCPRWLRTRLTTEFDKAAAAIQAELFSSGNRLDSSNVNRQVTAMWSSGYSDLFKTLGSLAAAKKIVSKSTGCSGSYLGGVEQNTNGFGILEFAVWGHFILETPTEAGPAAIAIDFWNDRINEPTPKQNEPFLVKLADVNTTGLKKLTNSIPCPVLSSLYNSGKLLINEKGQVSKTELLRVWKEAGAADSAVPMFAKAARFTADQAEIDTECGTYTYCHFEKIVNANPILKAAAKLVAKNLDRDDDVDQDTTQAFAEMALFHGNSINTEGWFSSPTTAPPTTAPPTTAPPTTAPPTTAPPTTAPPTTAPPTTAPPTLEPEKYFNIWNLNNRPMKAHDLGTAIRWAISPNDAVPSIERFNEFIVNNADNEGHLYVHNFANVICDIEAHGYTRPNHTLPDKRAKRLVSAKTALRLMLKAFGRVNAHNLEYMTVDDLKRMYLEARLPVGYEPPASFGAVPDLFNYIYWKVPCQKWKVVGDTEVDEEDSNDAVAPTNITCKANEAIDMTKTTWGVSGGGWRALSSAMGFARGMAKSGHLANIGAITSVSGGSWFTVQLAYSQEFFNGVTNVSRPINEFVHEWFMKYYKINGSEPATSLLQEKEMTEEEMRGFLTSFTDTVTAVTEKIQDSISATNETLTAAVEAGQLSAEKALQSIQEFAAACLAKAKALLETATNFKKLIATYFGEFSQILDVAAKFGYSWRNFIEAMLHSYIGKSTKPNVNDRIQSMQHIALLVNNVIPHISRVSNMDEERKTMILEHVEGFKVQNFYPLSWSVPASGTPQWLIGDQKSSNTTMSGQIRSSPGWTKAYVGTSTYNYFKGFVTKEPEVATLGAISSAAAGIIADPSYVNELSQGAATSIITHYGWKMVVVLQGNPGMDLFPAMDGGYIENTGMLYAISAAMRLSATPQSLKFVLLDSNECSDAYFTQNGNCLNKTAISRFWTYRDTCPSGKCLGTLNSVVFNSTTEPMPALQNIGIGRMQSLYFKGKTIENKDWHIKAGWDIEFVSLSINSMMSTINAELMGSTGYEDLAVQTEKAHAVLAQKYPHMFR